MPVTGSGSRASNLGLRISKLLSVHLHLSLFLSVSHCTPAIYPYLLPLPLILGTPAPSCTLLLSLSTPALIAFACTSYCFPVHLNLPVSIPYHYLAVLMHCLVCLPLSLDMAALGYNHVVICRYTCTYCIPACIWYTCTLSQPLSLGTATLMIFLVLSEHLHFSVSLLLSVDIAALSYDPEWLYQYTCTYLYLCLYTCRHSMPTLVHSP